MGKMIEWPVWQRWGVWLGSWVLYLGAFWALLAFNSIVVRVLSLIVLCAGLLLLTYASKAVVNEPLRKVDRGNLQLMLPTFVVYIVLMLYVWPMQTHLQAGWLKVLLNLSPVAPLAVVLFGMVRYVSRCDELERRQHMEAIGVAAAIVSLATFALGLLAAGKLLVVNAAMALLLVFPALCLVYGCICAWSKWWNRAR